MNHVDGKNKGNIVLYALSTCVWCKKTRRLLDELGVDYYYEYVDLADSEESIKLKKELERWSPETSFPTIVINNEKCIIGFDEDKILEEIS